MKTKDICPKCGSQVVGFQYAYDSKFHYDGVSEYRCVNTVSVLGEKKTCDYRIGRWCGRDLTGAEMEPKDCTVPYGHPMEMTIDQGNDELKYSPPVR